MLGSLPPCPSPVLNVLFAGHHTEFAFTFLLLYTMFCPIEVLHFLLVVQPIHEGPSARTWPRLSPFILFFFHHPRSRMTKPGANPPSYLLPGCSFLGLPLFPSPSFFQQKTCDPFRIIGGTLSHYFYTFHFPPWCFFLSGVTYAPGIFRMFLPFLLFPLS